MIYGMALLRKWPRFYSWVSIRPRFGEARLRCRVGVRGEKTPSLPSLVPPKKERSVKQSHAGLHSFIYSPTLPCYLLTQCTGATLNQHNLLLCEQPHPALLSLPVTTCDLCWSERLLLFDKLYPAGLRLCQSNTDQGGCAIVRVPFGQSQLRTARLAAAAALRVCVRDVCC